VSRLFRDLKVGGLYRLLCYPHATGGGGEWVRLTPGNLFLVLETRPSPRRTSPTWVEILMGSKIFNICLGPNDFEPMEEA